MNSSPLPDLEYLEDQHILRVRCSEIDSVHSMFVRLGNDPEIAALLTVAFEIRELKDSFKNS